jgi:hypothetical protein
MVVLVIPDQKSPNPGVLAFAWLAVGVPLLRGVLNALVKAIALFR